MRAFASSSEVASLEESFQPPGAERFGERAVGRAVFFFFFSGGDGFGLGVPVKLSPPKQNKTEENKDTVGELAYPQVVG